MDASIYWMLTSSRGVTQGRSPLRSQILEYAPRFGYAVQDFAHSL